VVPSQRIEQSSTTLRHAVVTWERKVVRAVWALPDDDIRPHCGSGRVTSAESRVSSTRMRCSRELDVLHPEHPRASRCSASGFERDDRVSSPVADPMLPFVTMTYMAFVRPVARAWRGCLRRRPLLFGWPDHPAALDPSPQDPPDVQISVCESRYLREAARTRLSCAHPFHVRDRDRCLRAPRLSISRQPAAS